MRCQSLPREHNALLVPAALGLSAAAAPAHCVSEHAHIWQRQSASIGHSLALHRYCTRRPPPHTCARVMHRPLQHNLLASVTAAAAAFRCCLRMLLTYSYNGQAIHHADMMMHAASALRKAGHASAAHVLHVAAPTCVCVCAPGSYALPGGLTMCVQPGRADTAAWLTFCLSPHITLCSVHATLFCLSCHTEAQLCPRPSRCPDP